MPLSYSKKTKCQGCKALQLHKIRGYICELGFAVTFDVINNIQPAKPKPMSKCWKPKTATEIKEAKKLIAQKNEA